MRRFHTFAIVLVVCFAGCAHRTCEPTGTGLCQLNEDEVGSAIAKRVAIKQQRPVSVLVLSGGGAYGAWGAGVLRGWRTNNVDPRPKEFDVVTAISTGSLLASHAFLGLDPQDDDELEKAYTTINTPDIYRKRFLLFVPFSESLYITQPLKDQLKIRITNEVIDRVGREWESGRRLYVGTTNLDRGKLIIWDMTCIAHSTDPLRYDKYRRILLAATAIPAFFPPVEIEGQLNADGGARAQLFLDKSLLPVVRRARAAASTRPAAALEAVSGPSVYVLINGKLGLNTVCVDDNIFAIALRSIENLLDANMRGDIESVHSLGLQEHFKVHLSYVPDDNSADFAAHDFNAAKMKKLYDDGVAWGRTEKWIDP
ncbi:MAG TPA: patatin-like phospholipase family protein [Tepidisphaeraceae bacterium]|nr:patatin-like phospholipase family protein [Tepidisphaeraceae bacterium]